LGAIVNGVVENAGLQSTPGLLYVWVMGLTTAVAIATSACVSRLEKRHVSKTLVPAGGPAFDSPTGSSFDSSRDQTDNPGDDAFQNPDVPQSRHGHAERLFTLAGIATMLVGALVFGGDIGFIALTIGVTLSIIFTESGKHAVKDVSWGVILLICGVITYIGLLERGGTVDWFGEVIARTGAPLIAAFLILLIGAVVSAAASTTGILGMLVPLSVPLIATGNVTAAGLTIALAISCSLVDLSPFSTGGAILMASAPESERAWNYRGLLTFTGIMIFVGPAVTWLLLVVPGW
jgi:di/tricarboxylate transporter